MKRVAFIGLDGMSWRVLATYKESFKEVLRLTAEGTAGICSSTPPYTPPSWTSISTGVRPEKHGILGFARPSFMTDSKRFTPLSSLDVKFPRISEILSLNGKKSLVVNHVLSYPPTGWYLKKQVLVSDEYSPKMFIYPPSLSRFSTYFLKARLDVRAGRKGLSLMEDQVKRQAEGVQELSASEEPDFLWVVFTAPDTLMHALPHIAAGSFDSLASRVFATIDEFVGNVKRTYDYLFIASDHGFDIYSKRINAYGLLAQAGLFPHPSMKSRILSSLMSTRLFQLMTLCGIKSKLTTGDGLRAMRRLGFPGIASAGAENLRGGSVMMTDDVAPDTAFVFQFPNDKMRELCIRVLSRKLGTMFASIKPISVDGGHAIIIIPADKFHFENRFELRSRSLLRHVQALHSPAGMYILHGLGVNREVRTIENIDVAPTLASILRVPLPLHYEGHSLLDLGNAFKGYLDRWRVARRAYWLREELTSIGSGRFDPQ